MGLPFSKTVMPPAFPTCSRTVALASTVRLWLASRTPSNTYRPSLLTRTQTGSAAVICTRTAALGFSSGCGRPEPAAVAAGIVASGGVRGCGAAGTDAGASAGAATGAEPRTEVRTGAFAGTGESCATTGRRLRVHQAYTPAQPSIATTTIPRAVRGDFSENRRPPTVSQFSTGGTWIGVDDGRTGSAYFGSSGSGSSIGSTRPPISSGSSPR